MPDRNYSETVGPGSENCCMNEPTEQILTF